MHASSGSSRSAGLHIEGRPVEGYESEQVGSVSGGLPIVAIRAPLVGPSLYLARVKRGLARSGTPPDRNILRFP